MPTLIAFTVQFTIILQYSTRPRLKATMKVSSGVKVRQTDLWPQPGLGTATNHSLVRYVPLPAALHSTHLVSTVTSEATHGV